MNAMWRDRSRVPIRLSGARNSAGRSAIRVAINIEVQEALKWLKSHSTKGTLDGKERYAIPSDHALGVAMKDIKALGKKLFLRALYLHIGCTLELRRR